MNELLGDMVAYRNLRPAAPWLPAGADLRPGPPPRKGDAAYAQVVAAILRAAHSQMAPDAQIERVVFVGDTLRSDGGAFETLCAATGWRGRALICDERPGAPQISWQGPLAQANAWQALYAFQAALEAEEFHVDQAAAVVIDLDKTLLGARGRNHALIDAARLTALRDTVAELLGASFEAVAFEQGYRELDQASFHALTEDNQDYLAYLCVTLGAGALTHGDLEAARDAGGFRAALALAGTAMQHRPGLAEFHARIAALVAAGDPTPFKEFRRREYAETLARMGTLPDDAAPERMLREELVLTHEVWEVAQVWRQRGGLLFGLSDKPDEAAIPTEEDAARGLPPLHRKLTHLVGV
jgi:hypothetical protein